MFKTTIFTAIILFVLPFTGIATENKPAVKEQTDQIVHCKTVQEIEAAKKQGALVIEKSGSYFIRVGSEYKGAFQSLETAKSVRQKYITDARKNGLVISDNGVFNPRLVIDPFVKTDEKKQVVFETPGGEKVPSSKVMIHAEPMVFNSISFGKIDLKKKGWYFAVTGKIDIKDNVEIDKKNLQFFAGSAVLGKGGDILWKTYGTVDNALGFKCLAPVTPSTIPTENLLIFVVAKGKIAKMQGADQGSQPADASGYDYHVLCSAILEMGQNWYPPIDETAKEEYDKMIEDITKEKIDKFKQQTKPLAEPKTGIEPKPVPRVKPKPKKTIN